MVGLDQADLYDMVIGLIMYDRGDVDRNQLELSYRMVTSPEGVNDKYLCFTA
jgi:hypothetical protein